MTYAPASAGAFLCALADLNSPVMNERFLDRMSMTLHGEPCASVIIKDCVYNKNSVTARHPRGGPVH